MSVIKKVCDTSELIDLVHKGDVQALDHMTTCYGDRLLAVGRRYCRREEDAHDAVQDALLSAGEHLSDFRGDGSLEGWLVRMVANACHRMRRGRKNDPSLHVFDMDLSSDHDTDPELLAGRGELAEAIGIALRELSPTDRLIFILAEGQDWKGPEIAEELSLSHNAVRSRLTRSRRRVREALEQHVPGLAPSQA